MRACLRGEEEGLPAVTRMRPVIAALLLALALVAAERLSAPQAERPISAEEGRRLIEARIASVGPERAYAVLKEKYSGKGIDEGHAAAHLFGEVLYAEAGAAGVAACDDGLNFGCYHGLFTAAVAKEGLAVVGALDEACETALGVRSAACEHGIGHGIVEHLGYGEDRLLPALEACAPADQPDPMQGCTTGVFMAHNMPVGESGTDGFRAAAPRAYREEDGPYAPCPSLPTAAFQAACYQELPLWWERALPAGFDRMGELCAGADGAEAREACFLGLGRIAASSSGYSVEGARERCALLPEGWYDSCIARASLAFVSIGRAEEGAALCRSASDDARSSCPHQP